MSILLQIKWDLSIGIPVVLSLTTLALNIIIYFKTRKEVRHNQGLNLISTIRQFNSDLRKWADEVVEQMTIAVFLCDLDPNRDEISFFKKRHEVGTKLSSLVDRGRFFLPNEHIDLYGQNKESAYRGFRSATLDYVLESQKLVGQLNYKTQEPNLEIRKKFVEAKKKFVPALSDELDPQQFERKIKLKLLELNRSFNNR